MSPCFQLHISVPRFFFISPLHVVGVSRVSDKVGLFTFLPKLIPQTPLSTPGLPLCQATPAVPFEAELWGKTDFTCPLAMLLPEPVCTYQGIWGALPAVP